MSDELNASPARRRFCIRGAGYLAGATVGGLTSASGPTAASLVRRESVDSIDPAKLQVIGAAVGEMMARSKKDPKDPRGWLVNADPHRAFCSAPGTAGLSQIHFCYWFLPWHRAFLVVLDRKIREIANDSTLCFPYWNWSSNPRLPDGFTRLNSPLANAIRFTPKRDLRPSEIDYFEDDPIRKKLGVAALGASKFVAATKNDPVDLAKELADSFGGLIRPNALDRYGNSRLEGTPHGPVHNYVGGRDPNSLTPGDMADFATAAKDPIFFAHHGNLDRLWEIWRSVPANRAKEPTTSDFLNHAFAFPWLDGTTMQITVAETLELERLGYGYDNLNVFSPTPPAPHLQPEAASQVKRLAPIVSTTVSLPPSPEAALQGAPSYLLLLEGVVSPGRSLSAGVYVSAADGDNTREVLVGTISVVKSGSEYKLPEQVLVFNISAAVDILKTPRLKVQVVPNELGGEAKFPYKPLKYKRAKIIRQ